MHLPTSIKTITLLAFLVLNVIPADPILTWSDGGLPPSAEAMERLRTELRAERGALARYADWGLALLRGDLGRSVRDGRPVGTVIAEALPWSLLLNLCAITAIYGLAIPFGLLGSSAPGEIAALSALAGPDVAVITSVSQTHLAQLGSVQRVAVEKASIVESLPAPLPWRGAWRSPRTVTFR